MDIKEFFDSNYSSRLHYWWKNNNRYSLNEKEHTKYNSIILKEAKKIKKGRALDLGAGEGADSIRLALLGFEVDAIDISKVGIEKLQAFALQNHVKVNSICCDITEYVIDKEYDIILCNGSLHYIKEKDIIINRIKNHTKLGGFNCISLFSTFSEIPSCHKIVPVYPDDENGIIENLYADWETIYSCYDREKIEISHDEMDKHIHSFIKLIKRRI